MNKPNESDVNVFYIVAVKDELTNTFMQPTFGDNMDALKEYFYTDQNNTYLERKSK